MNFVEQLINQGSADEFGELAPNDRGRTNLLSVPLAAAFAACPVAVATTLGVAIA